MPYYGTACFSNTGVDVRIYINIVVDNVFISYAKLYSFYTIIIWINCSQARNWKYHIISLAYTGCVT